MGEDRTGMPTDEGFDLFPIIGVVADFFAIATDRQKPAQFLEFLFMESLEGFLGLDPFRHVDATSNESAEDTFQIEVGRTSIEDPPVLAVRALEAILHLEGLAPLEVRDIVLQTALEVVRMNAFRPAVAPFLFHRPSRERQPTLVEVVTTHGQVRSPDEDRGLLHEDLVLHRAQPGGRMHVHGLQITAFLRQRPSSR